MRRRNWLKFSVLLLALWMGAVSVSAGGIELPMIPGGELHSYGPWTVQTAPTCTAAGVESSTCSDCGKVRTRSVAALGHSYGSWSIAKEPTFQAAGQRQKHCARCGDTVTQKIDKLIGQVDAWNIALGDMLRMNLHVAISQSLESTAVVHIAVGDTQRQYPVAELSKTEDGFYEVSVELAAAQMTVPVSVQVTNGADEAAQETYSVREYADAVLSDETLSQYHELVLQMLHYGAAAQSYFQYCPQELANSGLEVPVLVDAPQRAAEEISVTGGLDGIDFYAVSLQYRDRIGVRIYFRCNGNLEDYRFAVGDREYTPIQKGDLVYIQISGITPDRLDEQITLTVTDEDENVMSVSYSPVNYIVRMSQKGSDELKNLLKALYNYHLAAK